MEQVHLTLSPLNKTWIFDFDGTLVEHNGYKSGEDRFLPGALEMLRAIPEDDFVLILTAREKEAAEKTERFLKKNGVRFDHILYEMPMGERLLFNDSKPSGLKMCYSIECSRNEGLKKFSFSIDDTL
jgi:FMN phosphatase YigB (HAD superfamily)